MPRLAARARQGELLSSTLRRVRCLMQPTTVRLPAIRTEIRGAAAPVSARYGRPPIQSRVGSVPVVVPFEIAELRLQISGRPEQRAVQTFAPDGPNQPLDKWMRERHVRHRLDFFHVEYPQIRLPLVEPIQGIMVRAEVLRQGVPSSRSIEHPAQPHAINDAALHAKADDATRALVHHDENPVRAQDRRFTSKQIETPQTVLRVTEDREP